MAWLGVFVRRTSAVLAACAALAVTASAAPAPAFGELYDAPSAPCQSAPDTVIIVPRVDGVVRAHVWYCDSGVYYGLPSGAGPDTSRPLFMIDSLVSASRFIVDIRPLEHVRLPNGSLTNRGMKELMAAKKNLPLTQWDRARASLPFIPTDSVYSGSLMFTSLRVIPGQGYNMGSLGYRSRLIAVNTMRFLKPSDYAHLMSLLNPSRRFFGTRNAIVFYQNPGDGDGDMNMTLLPLRTPAEFQPGWSAAMASNEVRFFPMDQTGLYLTALEVFATAYNFYNASGWAEEDRQKCANWRAGGQLPPAPVTVSGGC